MRQEKRNSQIELVVISHIVNETIKFSNRTIEGGDVNAAKPNYSV